MGPSSLPPSEGISMIVAMNGMHRNIMYDFVFVALRFWVSWVLALLCFLEGPVQQSIGTRRAQLARFCALCRSFPEACQLHQWNCAQTVASSETWAPLACVAWQHPITHGSSSLNGVVAWCLQRWNSCVIVWSSCFNYIIYEWGIVIFAMGTDWIFNVSWISWVLSLLLLSASPKGGNIFDI